MSLDDKLIEAGFSDLTKSLKYGLPEEEGGLEFSQFELFAKSLEESLYQLCDTDDPECVNLGNANNFAYSALKRWTKESLELTGNILAKYFPECSLFTSGMVLDNWRFEYLHNTLDSFLNLDGVEKFSYEAVLTWDEAKYTKFESKLIENIFKNDTLKYESFSNLPLDFLLRNKDELISKLNGNHLDIFAVLSSLNTDKGRFELFSKDIVSSLKIDNEDKKTFLLNLGDISNNFKVGNMKISYLKDEIIDILGGDLGLAWDIITNWPTNLYNHIGVELANILKQDATKCGQIYDHWNNNTETMSAEVSDLLIDGICTDAEVTNKYCEDRRQAWWKNEGKDSLFKLLQTVSGNFAYLKNGICSWDFDNDQLTEKCLNLLYTAVDLDASKHSGFESYSKSSDGFYELMKNLDKSHVKIFLQLPLHAMDSAIKAYDYSLDHHFVNEFNIMFPEILEEGTVYEWAENIIERCEEDKDGFIGGDRYRIEAVSYRHELGMVAK